MYYLCTDFLYGFCILVGTSALSRESCLCSEHIQIMNAYDHVTFHKTRFINVAHTFKLNLPCSASVVKSGCSCVITKNGLDSQMQQDGHSMKLCRIRYGK
jgi:hypothetical protein